MALQTMRQSGSVSSYDPSDLALEPRARGFFFFAGMAASKMHDGQPLRKRSASDGPKMESKPAPKHDARCASTSLSGLGGVV